jgi:hypothetical protein
MKKKISAILFATCLLIGCSSGGGTSGSGGVGTAEAGGLLLTAGLSPEGVFTINIIDISDTTGGLFPGGVIMESYTVNYAAQSSEAAPKLTPRKFNQSVSIINSKEAAISVILKGSFTVREFEAFTPNPGVPKTYWTTVTYSGRTLNGERVSVSASTTVTFTSAEVENPVVSVTKLLNFEDEVLTTESITAPEVEADTLVEPGNLEGMTTSDDTV